MRTYCVRPRAVGQSTGVHFQRLRAAPLKGSCIADSPKLLVKKIGITRQLFKKHLGRNSDEQNADRVGQRV